MASDTTIPMRQYLIRSGALDGMILLQTDKRVTPWGLGERWHDLIVILGDGSNQFHHALENRGRARELLSAT